MADPSYNDREIAYLTAGDRVTIGLRRYRNDGPPVLLIHGASAGAETFMIPDRDGNEARSLADFLFDKGYEPWMLDWRASKNINAGGRKQNGDHSTTVLNSQKNSETLPDRQYYTMNRAAEHDIPKALSEIRRVRKFDHGISAIGWCLGSGVLAQSIAQGYVTKKQGLSHIVLMTLGLFYDTPVDTRLKAEERLLERLANHHNDIRSVDPNGTTEEWPDTIDALYQFWPSQLKPHGSIRTGDENHRVLELCNRLSFMYGMPYVENNLVPEIHSASFRLSFEKGRLEKSYDMVSEEEIELPSTMDTVVGTKSHAQGIIAYHERPSSGSWKTGSASGVFVLTHVENKFEDGELVRISNKGSATFVSSKPTESDQTKSKSKLLKQFGGIPLFMYINAARNVRQGWAKVYEPEKSNNDSGPDPRLLIGKEALKRFTDTGCFDKVSLMSGGLNRLWHRESIDRMYEWLMRGEGFNRERFQKTIFPTYGHQDLLWGKCANKDVFPKILDALPETTKRQ